MNTLVRANHDPAAMSRLHTQSIEFMAAACLPLGIGLGLVADPLVPLLLGEQWVQSMRFAAGST